MWRWAVCVAVAALFAGADCAGAGAARLVCYVSGRENLDFPECTHLVYAGDKRGDELEAKLREYRNNNPRLKIILRINEVNEDLPKLLKSKFIQGLELHDAHRTLNRSQVLAAAESAKKTLASSGGGPLFLSLPSHPELLAKYYDMRGLMKKVDLMMVQTHALGAMKKMTYHPSRLSGLWDMMNTDSVVDLVVGLGVPASKIVVSLPATVQRFTLQNETLSTPGSPAEDDAPKEIDQAELCRLLQKGRWTLERDQDLSAPYAFKDKTWVSFEDASSLDVKGKYARVRGLAGLALHQADRDVETPCAPTLRASLAKVLNQQSRAPRAAVLRSLEQEILSAPREARAIEALQVSPYRITQVVDSDGVIHSIREDTRTEFSCTRQGYFVHPRSCARFYRCVKFDQTSADYTVFEFDCPAGLAFDSRYEVCVWPGSLPNSQACPGSSEIAPVPHTRFVCPAQEGYYADPENCRWFFACLDHGQAALVAYEFRCPFGLGFNAAQLKCDWPWLVPACGNIARYEAEAHGYSGALLTGATGFRGQTADAINVAAHNSLVSGASLNNLVGIQSGLLSKAESLDSNFIASQELANGANRASQKSNSGLVQATQYNKQPKYTSGSLILDDYRQPTKSAKGYNSNNLPTGPDRINLNVDLKSEDNTNGAFGQTAQNYIKYQASNSGSDNSGQYVHDPSGDYSEPYRHEKGAGSPYVHQDSKYTDYFDSSRYTQDSDRGQYNGQYSGDNSGKYVHDNSGSYVQNSNRGSYILSDNSGDYVQRDNFRATAQSDKSGAYRPDYSGQYRNEYSGQYIAGVYQGDGRPAGDTQQYFQRYNDGNTGNYFSDNKAFTGVSHTLTNGAVNVGLVGKTTLVDAAYNDQFNYKGGDGFSQVQYQDSQHFGHPSQHLSFVDGPSVSINHIGTASHNLDGYSFVATPTDSTQYTLVPTTPAPFAVTSSLPSVTTYRTTFIPEVPRTSIKQVFGVTQPPITYVQPTLVPVTAAPSIQVTDHNQGVNVQTSQTADKSESGYTYSKPTTKFEDGVSYTTPAPVTVSTFRPQEFGQSQQTLHNVESVGFEYANAVPVTEEPFKKIVAYTTGTPVSFEPSVATYTPRPFSIQTNHELQAIQQPQIVEFSTVQPIEVSSYQPNFEPRVHHVNVHHINTYLQGESAYGYSNPGIQIQSTTPAPSTVLNGEFYSQQTQQTVSTKAENGYEYTKPTVQQVTSYTTPAPKLADNKQTKEESGYEYSKPAEQLEIKKVSEAYPTAATIVTLNNAQSYSQPIYHNIQEQGYVSVSSTPRVELYQQPQFIVSTTPRAELYQQPAVSYYENPILQYAQRVSPVTYAPPIYVPQTLSHQTLHKVETNKLSLPSASFEYINPNYAYQQPNVQYEFSTVRPNVEVSTVQPQVQVEYTTPKPVTKLQSVQSTTAKPATVAIQPVVSTTPQPHVFSHQTLHNVDVAKINSIAEVNGYDYQEPIDKLEEAPRRVIQYTTPAPVTVSTYRPQFYNEQYLQKVERPLVPQVEFRQPAVTYYQNPILKYVENATPKQTVIFNQSFRPLTYQTIYQPEIQREYEDINSAKAYSDATLVSQQAFRLGAGELNLGQTVSSTPAPLVYEQRVSTTPASLPYEQSVSSTPAPIAYEQIVSSTPAPILFQQIVSSTAAPIAYEQKFGPYQQEYIQTQDSFDYKPLELSQQYVPQRISYGSTYGDQRINLGSVHQSELPGIKTVTKYEQVNSGYEAPEIPSNSEEFIQPIVSTISAPTVTSTYRPFTVSTSTEYLASKQPELISPTVEVKYRPPLSTTPKPILTSTESARVESTTSREYLSPLDKVEPQVVNFESFGFKTFEESSTPIAFNPYLLPQQQNILVENNNNLLGFGTVGPDAGLVSPVTYTTSTPYVVSSEGYSSTTQLPIDISPVTIPVRRLRPKVRPVVTSTTETPRYKYVESTTYKAPEYLPPDEEVISTTFRPVTRHQNLVVQTAKSNVLGFGTVGPDAGLVSTFSTATPLAISSTEPFFSSTSTFAPITGEPVEFVRPRIPLRRTKPKVAVVTKINDFNPLLVRKLGAVCSCQSPIVVLRGRRPIVQQQTVEDYDRDYEFDGRGDIADEALAFRSERLFSPASTTSAPLLSSSLNPIIVPDDSYYQDLEEASNLDEAVTPVVNIKSSTTPTYSTTSENIVKIRPRIQSVTVAPTYKTVLVNENVTPAGLLQDEVIAESYAPSGREATLQATVDCQRAGLFRHPKHCNKFYSCRWDCTKLRFTVHEFKCPVQLSFDPSLGACNWPSQGPACQGDTLLTNTL